MKSANSAVKSVVTVESESPKNSTLPKDTKTQKVKLVQVSSTKKWTAPFIL